MVICQKDWSSKNWKIVSDIAKVQNKLNNMKESSKDKFKLKAIELNKLIEIKEKMQILSSECNISVIKKNWKSMIMAEYEKYTILKDDLRNIRLKYRFENK